MNALRDEFAELRAELNNTNVQQQRIADTVTGHESILSVGFRATMEHQAEIVSSVQNELQAQEGMHAQMLTRMAQLEVWYKGMKRPRSASRRRSCSTRIASGMSCWRSLRP